ncbi:10203_t:CDS:1, partial [Diversispora eburnea]
NEHKGPYESIAIDYMGNAQMSITETDKLFCHYTNLPAKVILREGMRVMFLNNSLFTKLVPQVWSLKLLTMTQFKQPFH